MTVTTDAGAGLAEVLQRLVTEFGPLAELSVSWPGSPAEPGPAHPVGVPGWRSPEPVEPRAVLPDLAGHIDLLVRGDDGGYVVYVTVAGPPTWTRLIHIVVRVAALVLPGGGLPSRIGRLRIEGRAPAQAVLEVRPGPAGTVDVRLQDLCRFGSLEFRRLA